MAKARFSFGFQPLDQILDGIESGELFLLLNSHQDIRDAFLGRIAEAASKDRKRFCLISARKPEAIGFPVPGKPVIHMLSSERGSKKASLAGLVKFMRMMPRNSYLVVDDVSTLANLFSLPAAFSKFIASMKSTLLRKNCVFVGALSPAALPVNQLIQLKDAVDLCFEVLLHDKLLYFHHLVSRGRLLGGGCAPVKVRMQPFLHPRSSGEPISPEIGGEPGLSAARPGGIAPASLYSDIFQRSPDPMAIISTSGDVREFNDKCISLLGYQPAELRTTALQNFVIPDERWRVLRVIIELRRKTRIHSSFTLLSKSGKRIFADIAVASTGTGFFVLLIRDVTERRKQELTLTTQLKEARRQFEVSSGSVLMVREGKIVYCGNSAARLFGFEGGNDVTTRSWKSLLEPESARRCQNAFAGALQGTDASLELTGKTEGGGTLALRAFITTSRYDGKEAFQIALQDVTPLQEIIKRLSVSEARLSLLIDRAQEAVSIVTNGRITLANRACVECYGFESDAGFLEQDLSALVNEGDREHLGLLVKKITAGRQAFGSLRTKGLKKDGTSFDLDLLIHTTGGIIPDGVVVCHRDVSAMVAAEAGLSQLRKEFAHLDELVPALGFASDDSRMREHILGKVLHLLKMDIGAFYIPDRKAKLLRLRASQNLPAAVAEKLAQLDSDEGLGGFVTKMLVPQFYTMDRYPSFLPHRVLFNDQKFSAVCLLPLTHAGKLAGMMLLASRKNVPVAGVEFMTAIGSITGMIVTNLDEYQRVATSAREFHSLAESMHDVVYKSSADGKMLYVNPHIEVLTGYKQKEFYANKTLWLSLVHQDDKKVLLQRITDSPSMGDGIATEYRILPKGKATYRWVRDAITFMRNEEGIIDGVAGMLTDVTSDRETVQELRVSNLLRGSILSSMQEGVLVTDRSFRVLEWNGVMEVITGLKRTDVVGKSIESVFPSEGQQNFQKLLRRALEGEYVRSEEFRPVLPALEKEVFLWGSFSPLRNESGGIEGVVGVVTDISERKQLERDLRESEQVLRNVIDTMSDILLITDLKGRVLQVNRTFLQNLGYSRQECLGQEFPYPWVLEEEMGRFVLWIANLREKNWLHDFDMTWRTKDDELISMSLSTTLLRNSYGEPIAMLNIARDITERRRLMKELQHRNRQVELINRIISAANQTMDFAEIFMKIATEIRETVPCDDMTVALLNPNGKTHSVLASLLPDSRYAGDQVPIERTAAQYAIISQQPVIIPDLAAEASYEALFSFQEGMRSEMSIPIVVKGKVLGTFNLFSYEPHTYHDEHASTLVPVAQQIGVITDRVRLFRQVSDDAMYIHKLLDSIDSVVYTVDTGCRIREVNKAWYDFVRSCGVHEDLEYHGMDLMEAVPGAPLKTLLRNVVGDLLAGTIRSFAQEFSHESPGGERSFHLTINPMVIESRVIGLVISHTDITALKQTEHELKRNYEQLLALNEISTLISTSLNLEDILHGTIPLLRNTFEASGVLVYLRDRDGEGLTLAQKEGLSEIPSEQIRFLPENDSITGYVMSTKDPLYISDQAVDDVRILDANRPILRKAGIRSLAAIPLMSKDKVHGALDILFTTSHDFPSQFRQMLTLIGNQLGAAIENALLYKELLSQIARLTVLYELSQQLTSTLDSRQIFKIIYEHTARIIHFDLIRVNFIDARRLMVLHSMSVQRIAGEFIESTEPGASTRIPAGSPEHWVLENLAMSVNGERTMIHLPMYSKGAIMGILSAYTGLDNAFSGIQMRMFESIGNLAAIALEKAMFYEETVQKSQEIERRNKELDDFTYVVSHDLKEPLISIEGFGKILQLDYQESIGKEGKEYLDSILGASTRMKGLIDDLLMLSRVSRPSEAFRVVSTKKVISEIRTDLDFTIRQKGAELIAPDDLPAVIGNETHIKVVFQNLIGNALKFNEKVRPVIEITFQNAENNYYLFSVRDNGIGISPEFFDKIFVIFQRLHRREDYEGSGAGLAIVKKIIEIHKGKIWVTSEIGRGSTFFFTLPKVESEI